MSHVAARSIDWKQDTFLRWWLGCSIVATLLVAWSGNALFLLAGIVGVAGFILVQRRIEIWVSITVLLYGLTFMKTTDTVSTLEIVATAFWVMSFALWFVTESVFRRRSILRHYDKPLLAIMILMLLSIILAVAFESSLVMWVREIGALILMPLYIPMREAFRSEKKRRVIFGTFILMTVMLGVSSIIHYKARVASAFIVGSPYMLESRSIVSNEMIFSVMLFFALVVGVTAQKKSTVSACIALGIFCVGLLIISFGRLYWISSAAGVVLLVLVMGRRVFKRSAVIASVVAVIIVSGMYVVYHYVPASRTLFALLTRRLVSSKAGTADISLRARVVEAEYGLRYFLNSPIVGYGMGSLTRILDIILGTTSRILFFHNGYVWILVKFGILGFVAMVAHYAVRMKNAFILLRSKNLSLTEHSYAAFGFISVLMMLVSAFTGMVFMLKYILLIMAFVIAVVDWLWEESHEGKARTSV